MSSLFPDYNQVEGIIPASKGKITVEIKVKGGF